MSRHHVRSYVHGCGRVALAVIDGDQPDVRILGDAFLEPLFAQFGGGGARDERHQTNLARTAHEVRQYLGGFFCSGDIVRGHQGLGDVGFHPGIHHDHRNASAVGLFDYACQRILVTGSKHDAVHTTGYHILHNIDLLGNLGLLGRSLPDDPRPDFRGPGVRARFDRHPELMRKSLGHNRYIKRRLGRITAARAGRGRRSVAAARRHKY